MSKELGQEVLERRPGRPKPSEPKVPISLRITVDQNKRLGFLSAAFEKEKGSVVGLAIDRLYDQEVDKIKEVIAEAGGHKRMQSIVESLKGRGVLKK